MSLVRAASAFIAKMWRGDAQPGMVEDAALARVVLAGDVDAGLLVEPPWRQAQVLGDVPGLVQNDAVRHEQRVHVPGHARGVVGQRHRGPADDEDVGDHAPAGQSLA